MIECAIHDPEPHRYSEKHKPGKRVYIAGGISNVPLFRLRFSGAALILIFRGYEPVNPASIDFGPEVEASWEDYMRARLPMLATCDYIYLLPGWEDSRGARLEKQIADALGIKEVPTPHNNVTYAT